LYLLKREIILDTEQHKKFVGAQTYQWFVAKKIA
jgi:hypothetical protein